MMNKITLSYDEYIKIVSESKLDLKTIDRTYENVLKFIYNTGDQKSFYLIDEDNGFTETEVKILRKFGISTTKYSYFRSYKVVFIDPNKDTIDQVNDQMDILDSITHMVVLSDDIKVIKEKLSEVKPYFPDLKLFQYTYEFDKTKYKKDIEQQLGTDNLMDLVPYLQELDEEDNLSAIYIDKVNNLIKRIHADNTSKSIYFISDTKYYDIYRYIVAELYNLYDDKFYVETSRVPEMISLISSGVNKDLMLKEEYIDVLTNFPRYCIYSEGSSNTYRIIALDKPKLTMGIRFIRTSFINNLSQCGNEIIDKVLDLSEIEVMSLESLYPIPECKTDIANLIRYFYSNVEKCKDILSIVDLIYFKYQGEEYIGYVYKDKVKVPYAKYCSLGSSFGDLSENELNSCIPVTEFLDGPGMIKNFLHETLGEKYKYADIKPHRVKRPGSLFLHQSYRVDDAWNKLTTVDEVTVGLHCMLCHRFRTAFYIKFRDIIGLDRLRSIVDIYGGFNPISTKRIEI